MRRCRGLVERINRDRLEDAELDRKRLLECGAALRLFHIVSKRRPWQGNAGPPRLGRPRPRLRAATRRNAALAAGDALGGLVQITDRAFAADRAVIAMLRLDAETFR